MLNKKIVVFYFPWKEISGGPYYLTGLANKLAEDSNYEVYYTDYNPGLSDSLLDQKVRRIRVDEKNFSIPIQEPCIFVTPIYWACWLPKLHEESKILFFNWHVLCLPVLQDNVALNQKKLELFLRTTSKKKSCFFSDESHWLSQCVNNISFEKAIVPISTCEKNTIPLLEPISNDEINLLVLSRLSVDKVYSITNLLSNFERVQTNRKKILHIIGDGDKKDLINPKNYSSIEIVFYGTLVGQALNDLMIKKADILFAMGTSVLEGASLRIPSVIIPHETHSFEEDSYVYLQKSSGYCLGWPVEHIPQLNLSPISLSQIIEDIYLKNLKALLGNEAFDYYRRNHTIEATIIPFKNSLSRTKLTYGFFRETLPFMTTDQSFRHQKARLTLWGFRILTSSFNPSESKLTLYLWRLPILKFIKKPDGKYSRIPLPPFSFIKKPLSKALNYFCRKVFSNPNASKFLSDNLAAERAQLLTAINKNYSETFTKERSFLLNELKYHSETFTKECSSIINKLKYDPNSVDMDPGKTILSEASLQHFCGNIKVDYQNLIRGLDETSIRTVVRFLSRIREYRKTGSTTFHFSDFEKKELEKIYDKHRSHILELSDNCYAYGPYLLPENIITTSIFYYDCFLHELKDLAFIRSRHIIDAGGFIGDSALILCQYTNKDVHVFEPVTSLRSLCEKTMLMNSLQNVVLNPFALGSENTSADIIVSGDTSRFETCIDLPNKVPFQEKETVTIIRLDDYVSKKNLNVGLIKVDIEGFEQELLKGARETIVNQKPSLLLSIYHNAEDFFHIKTLLESWNLGYEFKIRKPSDYSVIVDTMLIVELKSQKNI
jgi:FkbM family methyltransferase